MSERKRIAIYTSSFPPKGGGIASAHYNLFLHFSRHHDVRAFVFRDSDESKEDNVIRAIPFFGMRATYRRLIRGLLRQPTGKPLPLCDEIAETAASVVRMNGTLRRFAPHLIICPDHYLPALMLRKPKGAKLAWMARHNYLRFVDQPLSPPRDFNDLHLAHRLELRAVKKADILISPSQYMRALFEGMFGAELPAFVAKNFINEKRLANIKPARLKEKLGIDADARLIYVPSGGAGLKGSRYTYEITRRLGQLGNVAFYIPGPVAPTLLHELQTVNKDIPIYSPGSVAYDENLSNVAACDLTVSPTLIENLSNAFVESIKLGVPVVTFDTGGNKEIVQSEKTGFVVPYGDIESLVRAASTLLEDQMKLKTLRDGCAGEASSIINQDEINATYDQVLATL